MHLSPDRPTRGRSQKIVLAALATLTCFSSAYADEFYLTTGKVVYGAVQSETADRYVIQTEVGTINVPKSDVVRTVSTGSSAVEVQGDIAAKKGDVTAARTAWTQALNAADKGSAAETRLKDKLARLNAATRQAAANEITALLAQAQTMLQAQRLDAAQAALDKLHSRIPANDEALTSQVQQLEAQIHYARGIAARDAVKLDLAQQELEQAIAANPSFYPAYIALGESLMGNSATVARGTDVLEEGLRVAGNRLSEARRYEILYELAQKYFESKKYARAATTYAALIPAREKYPAYANALDRAVESYVKTSEENMSSDFQQTIDTLNRALKLNPQNEKALFLLGRIYLDMGQLENAVLTLQRLVEVNPAYPEGQLYLGRAYFKAHDYDNAIKHLSAELALNGNSYQALVDRAEAEINVGKYTAAETDLATARAIDSNNWLGYYLTASLAYKQGNYEAAQTALTQALTYNRAAIPAHLLMGRVLDARNQPDGARQWLEQVVTRLKQEPDLSYRYKLYLAEALTRLGEISIRERSPRQAENYLKEALEVAPNFAPALDASADAMLLMTTDSFAPAPQDLYKRAEDLYLRAIKIEPQEPEHYLKLARFYQQYPRDNEKAREYFNQYVDAGGRNTNVNSWLAEVGGQPRDEITSATAMAAAAQPVFPGTVVTTSTATQTTGPAGSAITTTTMTGVVPPAGAVSPLVAPAVTPGITAPPPSSAPPTAATPVTQVVTTETSSAQGITSGAQVLAP